MAKYKAVIFDVDGTLVDSVDLHARAWVETMAEFGRNIPFAEMRHEIGKGGDEILKDYFSKEEIAKKGDDVEERRGEIFKARYLDQVRGFPKVRELFERLRAAGLQVVLASSAAGDELKTYKKVAQIEDLVDEATSKDDVEKSKPNPDIFQAALSKLKGVEAHEAVVVGDTHWDAIAAKKAGLGVIGVLCGGFAESELREHGCHSVYADPADLLEHYFEIFA